MVIRQAVTMLATRGSSPDGTMRVLSVAAAGLLFRARAVIRHAPFASQSPIRAWAMAVKAHVVGAARVAPARPFHLPRAQVAQIHRGPLQAAEFQCAVPQRLLGLLDAVFVKQQGRDIEAPIALSGIVERDVPVDQPDSRPPAGRMFAAFMSKCTMSRVRGPPRWFRRPEPAGGPAARRCRTPVPCGVPGTGA
jgi:hypothetical protein